jgi:glycosyltransferase involved in cell wall biosynthesis
MKILIINVCGQSGSTGRIISILKRGYEEMGHKTIVCYGSRREKINEPNYFKITKPIESYLSAFSYRLLGYQGLFLSKPTRILKSIIEKEKPNIVQLLNIHGYYLDEFKLLEFLSRSNIPTVFSMMDEYAYMGKCMFSYDCNKFIEGCKHCPRKKDYPSSLFFDRSEYYFKKKSEIYDSFNKLIFTGVPWVVYRAKQSKLLRDRVVEIVNEPIDLDKYYYPQDSTDIRKELGISENSIVVMTVAPLSSPRKGGKFFLDLCDNMHGKEGYTFVYVGYDTDVYKAPKSLIKIPYVSSKERLAKLICMADVLVSTTLSDTIPNTCIIALGCGTPICGFDISGLSFIGINNQKIVKLVKPFDLAALEKAVMSFTKKNTDVICECRNAVYSDYSPSNVTKSYIRLFKRIVGEGC